MIKNFHIRTVSHRFPRRVHTGDKKQIIDNSRKPFAFSDGRLNNLAVFGGCAIARESDLRLAHDIGNGRPQLVREISRKLREPRERIVEPPEHLIESACERS